mmetsp:Transcript_177621/g.563534  ORF Transcript_177621/g.563534 Transcript_177621/m.563534 type:complete len:534 (+) Transcript_177621:124-1725(+)
MDGADCSQLVQLLMLVVGLLCIAGGFAVLRASLVGSASVGRGRHDPIPVLVVEEHAEALSTWLHSGVYLRNATVLRFDGHPGEPLQDAWHRATLAGSVRLLLWVWPDWYMSEGPLLDEGHLDLAYRLSVAGFVKDTATSCWCESAWLPAGSLDGIVEHVEVEDWQGAAAGKHLRCHSQPFGHLAQVKEQDCRAGARLHQVRMSRKSFAALGDGWLEALAGRWGGGVILDIDEDFVSVHDSADNEFDNAVGGRFAARLDAHLEALCPRNMIASERIANSALRPLLRVVGECTADLGAPRGETAAQCVEREHALATSAARALSPLACAGSGLEAMRGWVQRLLSMIRLFAEQNPSGIRVLETYGFCLRAAPRTLSAGLSQEGVSKGVQRIRLCGSRQSSSVAALRREGRNAALQEHPDEIEERLGILRAALLAAAPAAAAGHAAAASLVRSVRRGATPKRVWKRIEDGLLDSVRQWAAASPRHRVVQVAYDSDLLGGPGGWVTHSGISAAALDDAARASADLALSRLPPSTGRHG